MNRMFPFIAAWLIFFSSATALRAQGKSPLDPRPERRYSHGPLTAKDYEAEPPHDPKYRRGRQAGLATDIRYEFHFQTTRKKDRLLGHIDSLAVYAVVLRAESWNLSPEDKALLDHQQGLFDLTQIEALKAQIVISRRLDDEPLEATGKNRDEVQQTLDRELRKLIRPYVDGANETKAEFDRVTRIGSLAAEESQARQQQRELLRKFTAEAAKIPAPVP